ncbi:MAG: SDR family NAD(P)-dependent oxidoreductase [Rhodospirillales bacterium]|nr:SDR family NAD(P)-dependent oxidoreductase [Rhodospirillales bacterium]
MTKTWLITGCSSGFGRIIGERALERGDRVVLTARDPASLQDIARRFPDTARAVALDVTRPGAAQSAVAAAIGAFGSLDILVNNAGFGFIGAIEEGDPDEYRPMYETNVFGLIETTKAALPALRASGNGRIVNLSSIGGVAGRAGFGFYNGTKFAVEGISEALAQEVAPFGIAVIIVEPGAFRTEFLGRSINMAAREMEEYVATAGSARVHREADHGSQPGDPEKAVAVLLKAIDAAAPPLHLLLGKDAYSRARRKFEAFAENMADWEAQAADTGYPA